MQVHAVSLGIHCPLVKPILISPALIAAGGQRFREVERENIEGEGEKRARSSHLRVTACLPSLRGPVACEGAESTRLKTQPGHTHRPQTAAPQHRRAGGAVSNARAPRSKAPGARAPVMRLGTERARERPHAASRPRSSSPLQFFQKSPPERACSSRSGTSRVRDTLSASEA